MWPCRRGRLAVGLATLLALALVSSVLVWTSQYENSHHAASARRRPRPPAATPLASGVLANPRPPLASGVLANPRPPPLANPRSPPLANPRLSGAAPGERTLQCPAYAGPMFFPYYPGAKKVPRHAVRAAALPQALAEQPQARRGERTPLEPFGLHEVRLERASRFGVAQTTNARFLRALDVDRLLYFFRQISSLPQPKTGLVPYGGWESLGSGLRGEFVGHYLHAAAAVAASSADALLRERCEYVVRVLAECQAAGSADVRGGRRADGYVSAFPQAEFRQVEDFESRAPWVPYYVMHKLLAGLIVHYELLSSPTALRVALRLAEHLRSRALRLMRKGLDVWHDFINQEVGGMSEALSDLARVSGNSTWLQLAAMFERPCFIGPLARGEPESVKGAIERVHANAHLPQLLGTMARYEATGDESLRVAAESFWSEVRDEHTFATGGSTTGEVWLRAGMLGDAVQHQHKDNYWAHDQAETCVAHNSMRVARRLLQWGAASTADGPAAAIRHAAYYERTLYNAVLGTQRGTQPGEMLYMFPLGSGVSKAGIPNAPQGHHWSDGEHHFWCCQGSGIEAFARLADAIFWRRNPRFGTAAARDADGAADGAAADGAAQLMIMQLLPSELLWSEASLRVTISGDYPGSAAAGVPLRIRIGFARLAAAAAPTTALGGGPSDAALDVWVSWERLKDSRPQFASLAAPLYGPLVLAGLTYGARTTPHDAKLLPVPPSTSAQLSSLRLRLPQPATAPGAGSAQAAVSAALWPASRIDGCLVVRWERVWVLHPDRNRSFLPKPSKECVGRATPIEDHLSDFAQSHGGGKGYALDDASTASACAYLDGCLLPAGTSPFANHSLYLMHSEVDAPISVAAPPPTVGGTRKGGTDAANAASWRLTSAPVGLPQGTMGSATSAVAGGGAGVADASAGAAGVFIEAFDRPGAVLSLSEPRGASSERSIVLSAASATKPSQRWLRREAEGGGIVLESAAIPGRFLGLARLSAGSAVLHSPHRGAAVSREWRLALAEGIRAAAVLDLEPPFAEFAAASFWLSGEPAASAPSAQAPPPPPPFLLLPLNEVVDEHYTVYFCRAAKGQRPPAFCR